MSKLTRQGRRPRAAREERLARTRNDVACPPRCRRRLGYSRAGIGLVVYWLLPFDFWKRFGVSSLNTGPEMFFAAILGTVLGIGLGLPCSPIEHVLADSVVFAIPTTKPINPRHIATIQQTARDLTHFV
jgi:hypothetical protein